MEIGKEQTKFPKKSIRTLASFAHWIGRSAHQLMCCRVGGPTKQIFCVHIAAPTYHFSNFFIKKRYILIHKFELECTLITLESNQYEIHIKHSSMPLLWAKLPDVVKFGGFPGRLVPMV